MFDSLLVWHIPSAASEPVTTTFCVRFHSPSSMLKSYCSFNPLWTMNTTIFQTTSSLYPILEPIFGRLFQKIILGCSLRSSFIDPFSFAKKRYLFLSVMWSIIFPFFLSRFFSLVLSWFLWLLVIEFWINCAFVSLISSIFNGSEMNCSIVDWSKGFPNMVVWKMNIHEHWTRVTRFNSLGVSGTA